MTRRRGLLLAAMAMIGCTNVPSTGQQPAQRPVVWDLSTGRSTAALTGGKWTPPKPGLADYFYKYHVNSPHRFSLILENGERHEFADVAHVIAHREGDLISEISVQTRGMSTSRAVDELKQMHKRWNGEDLGDLSSWLRDVARGSELRHNSLIRDSTGDGGPEIMANILTNFGSVDDAWFIKILYSWPRDKKKDSKLESQTKGHSVSPARK